MEYRLSLTPRLLAVALCASVALLVLLFALGFQVGRATAGAAAPTGTMADRLAGGVVAGTANLPTATAGPVPAAAAGSGEAAAPVPAWSRTAEAP